LVTKSGFVLPSPETENGFIPVRLCFVEGSGTKQKAAGGTADACAGRCGPV